MVQDNVHHNLDQVISLLYILAFVACVGLVVFRLKFDRIAKIKQKQREERRANDEKANVYTYVRYVIMRKFTEYQHRGLITITEDHNLAAKWYKLVSDVDPNAPPPIHILPNRIVLIHSTNKRFAERIQRQCVTYKHYTLKERYLRYGQKNDNYYCTSTK